MKHVEARPYANPEAAARKLLALAAGVEPINGRIHIEKINGPFLSKDGCNATGAEFGAGLKFAIEKGWLDRCGPSRGDQARLAAQEYADDQRGLKARRNRQK